MALRTIVKDGDPILRKVCRPVEKFDEKLWTLLDDMAETMHEADGVRFLLLSLEQYLLVYQKSSKDGYRVNVRQKKDADKIRFIESKL